LRLLVAVAVASVVAAADLLGVVAVALYVAAVAAVVVLAVIDVVVPHKRVPPFAEPSFRCSARCC